MGSLSGWSYVLGLMRAVRITTFFECAPLHSSSVHIHLVVVSFQGLVHFLYAMIPYFCYSSSGLLLAQGQNVRGSSSFVPEYISRSFTFHYLET